VRTLALRIPDTAPVLPYDERLRDKGVSEQYRIARTRIVQHPRKPRIVVTTSPGPGDGKTTTALNLAGALALKATENVLLVDADLRRSSVHRVTGLPDRPGLADLLEHRCSLDEALVRTKQFPKLFVLPAGECRTNPAELLNSPEWSALEPVLRARFEHVVLDSPPMSIVADFDLIQAICDGVILVTRPDHTERKLFFRALESVPKDRLIGVVVNCVANWFLKRRVLYDPYHRYPYREKG
jgi:capsular exopolysaccharide synthesis family protein